MIRLITESEEFNRIIFNINAYLKDSKSVCDFVMNEFSLVKEENIQEDFTYYDDMFNIMYKSVSDKNKIISYISLSYAILLIIISIKFSTKFRIFETKDKGSSYISHKNKLFIYPDCTKGIKIMDNDKYLLIDYEGKFSFMNKEFTKLNDNFDYGKFLTNKNFKLFRFDESNFQYISNIHLERFDFDTLRDSIKIIIIPRKTSRYLIISGNLTTFDSIGRIDLFFDYYSQFYDKIFYVLGNYEFYNSNLGIDKTIIYYREYIKRYNWKRHNKKILFLEDDLIIFNNIHIIGVTLWSNITNSDMEKDVDYFKFIKNKDLPITYEDVNMKHTKSVIWLSNSLREINRNLPVLVISYNIPSYMLIDEQHFISEKFLNSGTILAFASNLDSILKNNTNIINWIIGHEYSLKNEIMHGTLFLSNSLRESSISDLSNDKNLEKEDYILI